MSHFTISMGHITDIMLDARIAAREFMNGRHELMAFIRLLVRDRHVAEDIFQDVCVALIDAVERHETIEDMPKWCRGAARNLAKRYWREQRRGRVVAGTDLLDRIESAFAEQQDKGGYWELRANALKECIDELPDRAKRLLRRRFEVNGAIATFSAEFNQTVETVRRSLSRIRTTLRECVDRKLKSELEP